MGVVLPGVAKPARYIDGEFNAFHKDVDEQTVRLLLAFPDVYEVGMSHLGLRILYYLANSLPGCAAERAFAPWPDMEQAMRRHALPLYGLESFSPAASFDVIGFSLQYEMSYTNVLTMLDLAGVPLRSRDRSDSDPLIVGGGPCAFNPEPVAEFFDAFVLGDGEDVIGELVGVVARHKRDGSRSRLALLESLARIPGVYVPAFYEPRWEKQPEGDRYIGTVPTRVGIPGVVRKRTRTDLGGEAVAFYDRLVVPNMEIIHDRVTLEVFRGCTRGCRFCQAGAVHRPVRERPVALLVDKAVRAVCSTGYEEVSLMSLNTADYSKIEDLLESLEREFRGKGVAISLPSLRADPESVSLASRVAGLGAGVRKAGITLAPEAGTQRLRNVINKNVTEQDLMSTVDAAVEAGWTSFKLYFMIGLPTETDEDVEEIASLARRVLGRARSAAAARGRGGRRPSVHVSASSFVPKPHTPFQWVGQAPMEVLERRQNILARGLVGRDLRFSYHDPRVSMLEAVFSRGDRRLSAVLEASWRAGARFDGWSETFNYAAWQEAFRSCGIDPADYACRWIEPGQALPWGHLSAGVRPGFLAREYEKAMAGVTTADCRWDRCQGCGVCDGARGVRDGDGTNQAEARQEGAGEVHVAPRHGPRRG